MLMIRLKRVGRKHDPSFRLIVTEKHRGPKSGKYIESVGSYDARNDRRSINGERVKYWIDSGAQLSPTVHNLLVTEKIISAKKMNALPKKTAPVKEVAPEETTTKAEDNPNVATETDKAEVSDQAEVTPPPAESSDTAQTTDTASEKN
jgi:small subunit ribosomal protein S16